MGLYFSIMQPGEASRGPRCQEAPGRTNDVGLALKTQKPLPFNSLDVGQVNSPSELRPLHL